MAYVRQRVEQLSGQLTRIMSHLPGSLNRLPPSFSGGGSIVLDSFLRTRINGNGRASLMTALVGPRSPAIPPTPASGPSATIYTDQAISAIETARTATLLGASFLLNKTFKHIHH